MTRSVRDQARPPLPASVLPVGGPLLRAAQALSQRLRERAGARRGLRRLRSDTLNAYRRACEFLGVDPRFIPDIDIVNPNKRVRSDALRSLVRRPPRQLRKVLHLGSSEAFRRRAGSLLTRMNTRFEPRRPPSAAAVESLRPLVVDEVGALKALLGIDLRSWLDWPAASGP